MPKVLEGRLSRIHVNRQVIAQNDKKGALAPIFTVKHRGKTHKASEVRIEGPCTLVYSPEKPLSCGAKAWIETESPVTLFAKRRSASKP